MLGLLFTVISAQQPWDLRRFASQAFFFNSPGEVLKRVPVPGRAPTSLGAGGVLWSSASGPQRLLDFGSLDDVVMGGVSESSFSVGRSYGTFGGTVSTDNNGGFAGCRSKALSPPLRLDEYTGLKLLVRGDGVLRRYKAIVRDSYDWNGIAWSQSFDAQPVASAGDDSWQEVCLPFTDFVPTLFARRVPGAQRVNTRAINTIQLTFSKFEYDSDLNPHFAPGPFALAIQTISVYK